MVVLLPAIVIEARGLTKDYGTVVAVKNLTFHVGKGEVVGFLGPNGAGKSTTLRMLAGFLGATAGEIRVAGHDIASEGLEARREIGYMPEAAPLYTEMRVREYLQFRAELKRVSRKERKKAVGRAMKLAAVTEMSETLIGHLSKGFRQRVGLADALVGNPSLLILDEPTAGLDPNQIRDVRDVIRGLGKEHTILLSTHILPEVEAVCDRAIVIDRGTLVAQGTLDELRASRRSRSATLRIRHTGAGDAVELLQGLSGVKSVRRREKGSSQLRRLQVNFSKESDAQDVLERCVTALVEGGHGVREASPDKASLEDVFTQLTRGVQEAAK